MQPRQLGERLPALVQRIVEDYLDDARTQHIDRAYLPSKSAMDAVCDTLLELTYPGYVGRCGLTRHNISYHVGELVPRLWESLCAQIAQALAFEAELRDPQNDRAAEHQRRAADLSATFVERIPAVRSMLAADVQAHYDGDPAATHTAEIILAYPGMLAITIHRYAHELHELGVPLLPRIMSEHAHLLTGIDIHPGAKIGRSFCIDHGTGVVIGETAVIGDNVKIYQGVTLGALSFPIDAHGRLVRGHKRHPTIGNNVVIYANAIILGGDTVIGDGAIIGGSVFVTQSVLPGHQVSITAPVLKVRPPKPAAAGEPAPDWVI